MSCGKPNATYSRILPSATRISKHVDLVCKYERFGKAETRPTKLPEETDVSEIDERATLVHALREEPGACVGAL